MTFKFQIKHQSINTEHPVTFYAQTALADIDNNGHQNGTFFTKNIMPSQYSIWENLEGKGVTGKNT